MNTAILFDTMSIQQYVFGSNKLKDNLGASYIIEHIYDYLIDKTKIGNPLLSIGYVGGGNALFFTDRVKTAKEIIKDYTTFLIHDYPGVSIAVAIKENFDIESYSNNIKELFQLLAENKGRFAPTNTIPSHGITDTCRFSSLSVEQIDKFNNLISSSTATKRNFEQKARKEEKTLLVDPILNNYSFPDEFEHLGQNKYEDSHISIVHIDGNGFGEVFRSLKDIEKTKNLSLKVKEAVRNTFIDTLKLYVKSKDDFKKILNVKTFGKILPIRPIVLGGDDVTFVCHGKLGIWFAENFMERFENYYIDEERTKPFSACAGIAIVKAKYPFYRAYKLAEKLCDSAKNARKKFMDVNTTEDGGNWLDFQFAYSGLGNTLEEIRSLQYDNVHGFSRPYCLENRSGITSLTELKAYTRILKDTLPNSKIKALRGMLDRSDASIEEYIEHLKFQHDKFRDKLYYDKSNGALTEGYPFFDMIELLELYPTNLLNLK